MGNGIRVGKAVYTDGWGERRSRVDPEDQRKRKAEYMKDYYPAYRETHREELRQNYRRCVPPLSELVPGYVPKNARREPPPPPCGGDCANCPWDDGCHYPEEAEGREMLRFPDKTRPSGYRRISREALQRTKQKEREKHKARMKTDPDYAEKVRERSRGYVAKYRAKVKWVKAGGSPARFEREWEACGGALERLKAKYPNIWKRRGETNACK